MRCLAFLKKIFSQHLKIEEQISLNAGQENKINGEP